MTLVVWCRGIQVITVPSRWPQPRACKDKAPKRNRMAVTCSLGNSTLVHKAQKKARSLTMNNYLLLWNPMCLCVFFFFFSTIFINPDEIIFTLPLIPPQTLRGNNCVCSNPLWHLRTSCTTVRSLQAALFSAASIGDGIKSHSRGNFKPSCI